ncbi:MupG family TIM beta-alpha barrel fold protein [Mesoplasma florum]|uniref:MupG family TIM beta-alpha barrel fold protein n=1 Tax=Mesoplasma florum TaxID=2151 RepID=UPI001319C7E0|nr:MupG family TIM beta-alpha barrel fold protein [Mesoplasma florum]
MFKKNLGISVYPEKFTKNETFDYIDQAAELGYKKIFFSLLQFNTKEKLEKNIDLYFEVIKHAKKRGFYIILDIADSVFEVTKSSPRNLSFFKELNIDCLRLDSPLLPKEVADATYFDIDIQLNISNNDSFINNVLDYQPVIENLSGSHNFYPQENTGLGIAFFKESTLRYVEKGIKTMAFIGSDFGDFGPQNFKVGKLVSLENHRNKPIKTQAKEFFASNLISDVIIGNQSASFDELKDLSSIDKNIIEFDVDIYTKNTLEKEIIFNINHFARGDFNENYLRSTMPRVIFKDENDILPYSNDAKTVFNKGDIIVINNNDLNYQKELIVVLKNNFSNLGNKANLVGKIKEYDKDLIDFVKPWSKFKFRDIKKGN